jgi:hypothetical protein
MMVISESAIMKAAVTAGSNKSITADDNNNLVDNDFIFFGEPAMAKSEIAQINAAVTPGTTFQVDSLSFPHNIGTPIYKIPYNQVKFYHAATLTGTKTLIGSAVDIDADSEYTTVVDTVNSTGYLFFQLYNSETTDCSDYSAGFSYDTVPYGSRIKIREFVTSPHNWNKPLDDDTFNALCDFAESEIFAIKRWRFREKTVSFNSVAAQQSYTKTEAGATDLGQLVYATYDGNPVFPINLRTHKRLNWNNTQQGIPRTVCEFGDNLLFTPIPSEIKVIELFFYRNSVGFANETVETEVKLPQAIGFRVLQDLWSTADMKKSRYFENRFMQTIAAMKLDDIKQVSKFAALSDVGMDDDSFLDQVDRPNRIS